jgi:hypothetical protein
VKIVALRTEYIVRERYINATRCLNIFFASHFICNMYSNNTINKYFDK